MNIAKSHCKTNFSQLDVSNALNNCKQYLICFQKQQKADITKCAIEKYMRPRSFFFWFPSKTEEDAVARFNTNKSIGNPFYGFNNHIHIIKIENDIKQLQSILNMMNNSSEVYLNMHDVNLILRNKDLK